MIEIIQLNNKKVVQFPQLTWSGLFSRCMNFSVEELKAAEQWESERTLSSRGKNSLSTSIFIPSYDSPFFLILFSLSFILVLYTSHAFFFSNSLSESFLILSFQRMDISCFIERDKEWVLAEVQLLSLRKDLVYCFRIGSVSFSLSFALFLWPRDSGSNTVTYLYANGIHKHE